MGVFPRTITSMFKDKNTQKVLGATVVILLVGFIGWYIVQDISSKDTKKEAVKGEEKIIKEGDIGALGRGGDVEIKEIPIGTDSSTLLHPKLGRIVVMPDRFTPEAIEILTNNIATLTTKLKEDPSSFENWSSLAIQYKVIDDFEGAVEIWKFLISASEGNIDSRINLGNIYHFQLREYEKSEAVFKEVIAINKSIVGAYTGLHELYRYSYKTDTTLALDILKEGVVVISDTIDLRMLLASYYTKLDMKDEALSVYEEVLSMAEALGNTNLVTIIEAAIQSLN